MNSQIFNLTNSFDNDFESANFLNENLKLLGFNTCEISNNNQIYLTNNLLNSSVSFVLVSDNAKYSYQVKKELSKKLNEELIENSFAQHYVENYYQNHLQKSDKTSKYYCYMPRHSKCLTTKKSAFQGFLLEQNKKLIFCLPNKIDAVKELWNEHIFKLLTDKFKTLRVVMLLKTFGLTKKFLEEKLLQINKDKKIKIFVKETNLVGTVYFSFPKNYKEKELAFKTISDKIKTYIFAKEETTLSREVFKLIKKNNFKIALAESVTGGNVASTLIQENAGISEFLIEGVVCYSNLSKIGRLNVKESTIKAHSAVSAETVFEMAEGLLKTSEADWVLCTSGIAENDNKKSYAFIGVGNFKGIHIYKTECVANRKEAIENFSNASLFHLLKNLQTMTKNWLELLVNFSNLCYN